MSRFVPLKLVKTFANGDVIIVQIEGEILKDDKYFRDKQNGYWFLAKWLLVSCKMVIGFLLHSMLNELLDERNISEREFDVFHKSDLAFHCTAFIYTINNFLLQNEFLQHTQFVNFYDQKYNFQSVLFVLEKLKSYINFPDQDLCKL